MAGRVLRHRIDSVSVAATIVGVGYSFACWLLAPPLIFLVPLPFLSTWVHLVEHNHVHLPVFRGKRLNEVFCLILCLGTAVPVEAYRFQHVETHHRFAGKEEDWTSPFSYRNSRFPDRPVHLPWYILTYWARGWRLFIPEVWKRRHTERGRRAWRSMIMLAVALVVLGLTHPVTFALYFLCPWIGNQLVPAWFNWRHHSGCDFRTKYSSANVNLGWFSRVLGFSIGYHSVHHEYPSLHWSLLKDRFYQEFAPFTGPERLVAASRRYRRTLEIARANQSADLL
ncbi:MAG: fatty acid desaturase [Actinomycetota bacterium]|nr:fatty acid desaturase [Actinomycetota bacterium]